MNHKNTIIVSNRSPYDFDQGEIKRGAGGLVKAMKEILGKEGLWIGISRGSDDFRKSNKNYQTAFGGIAMRKVFVPEIQYRHYYNEFANNFLWPLMHLTKERLDKKSDGFPTPVFSSLGFNNYMLVNRSFATAAMGELLERPKENVWIQDYHFMGLAKELKDWVRQQNLDTKIGQFWHIPWFNPDFIDDIAPKGSAARESIESLVQCLLYNDVFGFHTIEYVERFVETIKKFGIDASFKKEKDGYIITTQESRTYVGAFPIGINVDEVLESTSVPERPLHQSIRSYDIDKLIRDHKKKGRKILVGLERMDYTKGILERLDSIDVLLEKQEVVYIAFAQPSRTDIKTYQDLSKKVTKRVSEINKKYTTKLGYKPIIIETKHKIAAPKNYRLLQKADACLVTTLADGMNLVILEALLSKKALDEGRGIVVIGECGASYVLGRYGKDHGLIRLEDPFNPKGSAEQIYKAFSGNQVSDELIGYIEENLTVEKWSNSFISTLDRAQN